MLPPEEFAIARALAMEIVPYYSLALNSLSYVEEEGTGTMSCSKNMVLYVDPIVYEKWTPREIASVLIHEVSHILREHHKRADTLASGSSLNLPLWNRATDATINFDISQIKGIKLPDGALTLPREENTKWLPNMSPEQIYLAEMNDNNSDENSDNSSEPGDNRSEAGDSGQEGDSDNPHDDPNHPEDKHSHCGSSMSGGSSEDSPSWAMSDGDVSNMIEQVAQDIIEHNRSCGTVPGGILRHAEEVISPRVNYIAFLRTALGSIKTKKAGAYDLTYSRPRRRNADSSILLPTRIAPPDVKAMFVIDVSGSMSDEQVGHGISQLKALSKHQGVDGYVCFVDAQDNPVIYKIGDDYEILGSGGTDMVKPLIQISQGEYKPDIFFILTDGGFSAPQHKPQEIGKTPVYTLIVDYLGDSVPDWMNPVVIK